MIGMQIKGKKAKAKHFKAPQAATAAAAALYVTDTAGE